MRVGFTIILNGLHHLKNKGYYEYLLSECLDYLVVIDGATENKGSTSWSKSVPEKYHANGASIDGTVAYLKNLQKKYSNLLVVESKKRMWHSKDEMCNAGIEQLLTVAKNGYLWQIDADEQWTKEKMDHSELQLKNTGSECGVAQFISFFGDDIIARGTHDTYKEVWGNHFVSRLWLWKGEKFKWHTPAVLDRPQQNGKTIRLLDKFLHYSYNFVEDVKFKGDWYFNNIDFYDKWKTLQNKTMPISLEYLFEHFGQTKETHIIKLVSKENKFYFLRQGSSKQTIRKKIERELMFFKQNANVFDLLDSNLQEKHDNSFDLINLPGDGKYDKILNDLSICKRLLKSNGYIIIDNWNTNKNIEIAVKEMFKQKLFDEFLYYNANNGIAIIK